jgi:hypothetical protein
MYVFIYVLSFGVKRLGREADHSSPSSAEVKEWVELYLHSPSTLSCCVQLKHRDNFTFNFTWHHTDDNYVKQETLSVETEINVRLDAIKIF